ncbi:PaaI family thioesterase [Nocardioides houyundeii]|uniref:PaaI family thioesterase n=1 Tax=Nocardioides houyundeii TaxID=2045452 RepID=UPI000DF4B64D|nr:PaaI family thioesterase [Nocardioides houyundeii]
MTTEVSDELVGWFNALPISELLGLRCVEVRSDGALVEVHVQDCHRNPDGHVSGAVIAGAADVAAGIAVTGATGQDSATGDLSVHFLAPARSGPLRVEVEILRRGRRTCVPQVKVFDGTGRLCAAATGTWMLRDQPLEVG